MLSLCPLRGNLRASPQVHMGARATARRAPHLLAPERLIGPCHQRAPERRIGADASKERKADLLFGLQGGSRASAPECARSRRAGGIGKASGSGERRPGPGAYVAAPIIIGFINSSTAFPLVSCGTIAYPYGCIDVFVCFWPTKNAGSVII